jgi:hypothetical protein
MIPSIDPSLLSPSGHMSKRARKAAMARETARLFAEWGGHMPAPNGPEQPSHKETCLRRAAQLRQLAARGMCVRKYIREAERLEAEAR